LFATVKVAERTIIPLTVSFVNVTIITNCLYKFGGIFAVPVVQESNSTISGGK